MHESLATSQVDAPGQGSEPSCTLQLPALQVSRPLQSTPSSHALVVGVWLQPVAGTQTSSVHALPSSQPLAVQCTTAASRFASTSPRPVSRVPPPSISVVGVIAPRGSEQAGQAAARRRTEARSDRRSTELEVMKPPPPTLQEPRPMRAGPRQRFSIFAFSRSPKVPIFPWVAVSAR
jgi:hypothetical protein